MLHSSRHRKIGQRAPLLNLLFEPMLPEVLNTEDTVGTLQAGCDRVGVVQISSYNFHTLLNELECTRAIGVARHRPDSPCRTQVSDHGSAGRAGRTKDYDERSWLIHDLLRQWLMIYSDHRVARSA